MTASEFAFLALGLILGVASGAALSIVIRARPPAPHEVRVTMAQDAIPRRMAATLSGFNPVDGGPSPAWGPTGQATEQAGRNGTKPGSPAPAPTWAAAALAVAAPDGRTPVRMAVAPRPLVGIPIRSLGDRQAGTLAQVAVGAAAAVWPAYGQARGGSQSATPDSAVGVAEPTPAAPPLASAAPDTGDPDAGERHGPRSSGSDAAKADQTACAEQRRRAEERCGLASRLREEAGAARARTHEAQRAYDDHLARAESARAAADPRALRQAKETAWDAFRRANAAERSPATVEIAARAWLTEIDRINRAGSTAAVDTVREQAAASGLVTTIERLSLDADVARINAESAAEACQASLETLAACEESSVDTAAGRRPLASTDPDDDGARARLMTGLPLVSAAVGRASTDTLRPFAERQSVILKLLHGDQVAMDQAVLALAGEDPDAQTRWRLGLSGLVEAIVARAIEATALEFPADHPFWGLFNQGQCLDIARALSSLGYRFDGLGGFADGRLPSQRDLSLAIGYAGLDPMRVRHWPTEATMAELYRDVAITADDFLSTAAPDLTLGELVGLLGERAEALTELWNAWGRIRPVLLGS